MFPYTNLGKQLFVVIPFLFLIAPPVKADIRTSISILNNHPQILGEQAKGLGSEARVAQQKAQWLPDVSLSTDGGKRLLGSASDTQLRSIGDNAYIDLVVNGSQLLYDFGAVDGYIDEAKYRSQADALLDELALNALIGDLTQIVLQYEIEQDRTKIISDLLLPLKEQAELSKQRFEAGVSNGDDFRRLQMDIDRLTRDQVEVDRRLKDLSQKLVEQFALDVDSAVELSNAIISQNGGSSTAVRLSDQSRRYRERAANSRVQAAEAERMPRLALELELRSFDADKNFAASNELTGNLQITMPFFDGGALKAKARVAEFERSVIQQEQAFEQRVLKERTSQIREELNSLADVRRSLGEQRKIAADALKMALERQGKTAVEISQINSSLMSLYQLDGEKLDADLRVEQLQLELITLNEQWPEKFSLVVSSLENK
ncbi:TolC family protein [Marinobacterium sp. xm-a-152]|uniref:TolC family protein n=1 Tax=Marinobacterium sp. xm-a-152 TaxID=2497733 RepID=UPI0015682544|nr:TolC family protein [Marinobacterium sp. xm-a-152]NRP16373.1 Outer membrane efflux protein [Marinobacterium sp. xm-a-152]